MEKSKQQKNKVRFCGGAGSSPGRSPCGKHFEQLIERQTCEHFEEWLEQRGNGRKRCVKRLIQGQGHGTIMVSCPCS